MITAVDAVFVYGTLQPGADAWSVLAPWADSDSVAATVTGTLFDTGWGYPAACFGADTPGVVHGVVVRLRPETHVEALAALDRYEGAGYRRIVVSADGIDAFAYEWIGPRSGLTPLPAGIWPPA